MKILLDISYNSKSHFYEYKPRDNYMYIGYSREISSYYRLLFMVTHHNIEICRLEDDNIFRPWLRLLGIFIPQLRPHYTLKMEGLKENSVLRTNGHSFSIKINEDQYDIKGHSHCVVTIWKNGIQAGLVKRSATKLGKGYETIEVLYNKEIPSHIVILFSLFGWQMNVGRVNGNHTLTTIIYPDSKYDENWQPDE